jgi:hypothetical protein
MSSTIGGDATNSGIVTKRVPESFPRTKRLQNFGGAKPLCSNGQGGIRTHETREGPPVFKTGAFNHSATCPVARREIARRTRRIASDGLSINHHLTSHESNLRSDEHHPLADHQ